MHTWQIFAKVYDRHRGLPIRLSQLWKKTPEWYRSWSRMPKSEDMYGTGNVNSVVENYRDLIINTFAAASVEAALELEDLIHRDLRDSLTDLVSAPLSQNELRRELTKEFMEAICAFDECAIEAATNDDLLRWDDELGQASDRVDRCRAKIRVEREMRKAGITR